MRVATLTKEVDVVACPCSFSFKYFLMARLKCCSSDDHIEKLTSVSLEDSNFIFLIESVSFGAYFLEMLFANFY